ncbi:MAG: tRNA pseudouridine synthase A [Bacteroidota bacterium]
MHTMRLKVNDGVYDKLIWLLSKFNKDEVEIIPENSDFAINQKYLAGELDEILKGKASFIEIDEAELRLENILTKHENSI